MNIPVLLEPTANGFRATTGAPLNLTIEAATEEEALKSLRVQLVAKFATGCRIVDLGETIARSLRASEKLAADPQHEQFVEAMAQYREEREAADHCSPAQPQTTGISQ